jgi:hypothetical protein
MLSSSDADRIPHSRQSRRHSVWASSFQIPLHALSTTFWAGTLRADDSATAAIAVYRLHSIERCLRTGTREQRICPGFGAGGDLNNKRTIFFGTISENTCFPRVLSDPLDDLD